MKTPFLTAKWSNLLVVNYQVPSEILTPFVPQGTSLDPFEGKHFVSLVAFEFENNKLGGLIPAFPAYSFVEINLRFYVSFFKDGKIKKGVTFIREYVPSRMITWVAQTLYDEPYATIPSLRHQNNISASTGGTVSYLLERDGRSFEMSDKTKGSLKELEESSLPHFILEHYWGYTQRHDGSASEYEVGVYHFHTEPCYYSYVDNHLVGIALDE